MPKSRRHHPPEANLVATRAGGLHHGGVTPGSDDSAHLERTDGLFPATQWTVVLEAKAESETALSALCQAYRQPLLVWVRCWLRGWGRPQNDAEDLVQGCFQHLIRRDFLKNVARDKGRFRTFLLTCLKNHLRDAHGKQAADKRGGLKEVASLDAGGAEDEALELSETESAEPDREYDRAWAQAVLANALQKLAGECERRRQERLFRALEPSLFGDETALGYREAGVALGMSEDAVKTAAHRIRTRLKALVREEVLQTVARKEDWEDEIRYLIELSARSR